MIEAAKGPLFSSMFLVDLLSILSVIGIWPRFIEHRLLKQSWLTWELPAEHKSLCGLKILLFSDLHFNAHQSKNFLKKIETTISKIAPDLILFTGDFICYSKLEEPNKLKNFLQSLKAPLGCFCVFGNHDYARYVSRNTEGIYDAISPISPINGLARGLKTIFSNKPNKSLVSKEASQIAQHEGLCQLLSETPFRLLENETVTLPVGLNICGLGDLSLKRCLPEKAFIGYNTSFPGIVLSHNPDSVPRLIPYPGDWILSGHTHGEQIHFPWPPFAKKVSNRLARLEHPTFSRGLFELTKNKKLYVTRGVGAHKPFRFCSPPELTVIQTILKKT